MQAMKSVVWFASLEGRHDAYLAACDALKLAGADMKSPYKEGNVYAEGILVGKEKIRVFVFSRPTNFAEDIARTAHSIFLTGTLAGRPGAVALGDVVAITGSYHIDRGARHSMDGTVEYNFAPRFATSDVKATLQELHKAKLEHNEALPVAINTRREWVLDYLYNANKPLPMQEIIPIACDDDADSETKNKQWKKTALWLRDNTLITIQDKMIELTEQGKTYCTANKLASVSIQSNAIQIQVGNVISSTSSHAELQGTEAWKKFDREEFSPLGLDNDAYDMLGQYPNLTVIKAVTHFAGGDKGDKKDVIQKAAASAVTHMLLEI